MPNFTDRTINDFKGRLVGGGARPNLFECEMNFPAGLGLAGVSEDDDFRFMIKAAQIPGSTVSTIAVPFRGRTLKIAGDRSFDPWTITVINDTNYKIRNAFEQWMNFINRHDDNAGVITPAAYQSEMYIRHLGRGITAQASNAGALPKTSGGMEVLRTYMFHGCWPSDITPMEMSYDSSDTIQEFSVTIQYQWWDVLGDVTTGTGNDAKTQTGSLLNTAESVRSSETPNPPTT